MIFLRILDFFMIETEEFKDLDELLDAPSQGHTAKNHRIATRYVRDDIDALVIDMGFLSVGKPFLVRLVDITSKGALIESEKKLKINQAITLVLRFTTGKIFEIKAKVVRVSPTATNQFGVKFDKYNNELGDYLLETQVSLRFK